VLVAFRRAHHEYCSTHPDSKWANVAIVWTALPEEEILDVNGIMDRLCTTANLFPETTEKYLVEEGMKQRLFHIRRTWQQNKAVQRKKASDRDEGHDSIASNEECVWNDMTTSLPHLVACPFL
jgi:hypothetical protein